tara:strand:+ start:1364 stop:2314 length:951 start_codon:yes stop_codon:yes gene_type:complete
LKNQFKDYFHFSKIERRGIMGLSILSLLFIGARYYLVLNPGELNYSNNRIEELAQAYQEEQEKLKQKGQKVIHEAEPLKEVQVRLFKFNPNGLSIADWKKLGLSEKQAQVIKNYEEKGGKFRTKEDVQKMYTISDSTYLKLEPYILLPNESEFENQNSKKLTAKVYDEKNEDSKSVKKKKEYPKLIVDVNTADSATLLKLYGIGPYFSGKMVSYREALGGYSNLNQLTEIWNFNDSMLIRLRDQLVIHQIEIKKLNVNQLNAKELQKHPYINWNVANSIVNIRNKHGEYQRLEDLKKSVLISDSLLQKLSPYLTVE